MCFKPCHEKTAKLANNHCTDAESDQHNLCLCLENIASGFPQALEFMENLENHTQKSSMPGKIIEFEKKNLINH